MTEKTTKELWQHYRPVSAHDFSIRYHALQQALADRGCKTGESNVHGYQNTEHYLVQTTPPLVVTLAARHPKLFGGWSILLRFEQLGTPDELPQELSDIVYDFVESPTNPH